MIQILAKAKYTIFVDAHLLVNKINLRSTDMNVSCKVLALGALMAIAGIITALMSFDPSQLLQYIFMGVSVTMGVLAVSISRQAKDNLVRSKYYLWIGFALFALAISLGIWATTLVGFIMVLGFFLLVLGIIEFDFAQQIFNYEPVSWSLLGVKLAIAIVTATGAAWILTMVSIDANISLLSLGVLFFVVGLAFIQLSRLTKTFEQSVGTPMNNYS